MSRCDDNDLVSPMLGIDVRSGLPSIDEFMYDGNGTGAHWMVFTVADAAPHHKVQDGCLRIRCCWIWSTFRLSRPRTFYGFSMQVPSNVTAVIVQRVTHNYVRTCSPPYLPCCIALVMASLLLKGERLLSLSSPRGGGPFLGPDSSTNLSPPLPPLPPRPPRPRNPPRPRPPWRGADSSSSRVRYCLVRSRGDMLRRPGGALTGLSTLRLRLRDRLRLRLLL